MHIPGEARVDFGKAKTILREGKREVTDAFLHFKQHYGFEAF
ncbi:hypothetical protein [Desulfotomaculum nigrificans]|nr:hypothetical protein [Desulfotomaculum nigrificans]